MGKMSNKQNHQRDRGYKKKKSSENAINGKYSKSNKGYLWRSHQ